jgi:poly(hydroxyalkanoate) granule-associated protein
MAKAQEQGSKAIEALINDGLALQRKSQAEAQQRMQEATERLTSLASDFGQPNAVRTDRLEHLFEDRVAKALHRLGIPSAGDLQSLNERLERLERLLTKPSVPPKVTPAVTPQTARQKPADRKSAPKPSNNTVPPDTSAPGPTRKARRPAGGSSSA